MFVAVMVSSASAYWQCFDGLDVAGWDKYHVKPLEQRSGPDVSLEDCQASCSGRPYDCTFVVWNRENGLCWQKYSWANGPDGSNGRNPSYITCRWIP